MLLYFYYISYVVQFNDSLVPRQEVHGSYFTVDYKLDSFTNIKKTEAVHRKIHKADSIHITFFKQLRAGDE